MGATMNDLKQNAQCGVISDKKHVNERPPTAEPLQKCSGEDYYDYVELNSIPKFACLNNVVQAYVAQCNWFYKYGKEWRDVLFAFFMLVIGLLFLRETGFVSMVVGTFLLGLYHSVFANKAGHLAVHGAMCESKNFNWLWSFFFVDFVGGYSSWLARLAHVKQHHSYTNIIGIGDSSIWKIPFLDRITYLFLAPLALPLITPVMSVKQLADEGQEGLKQMKSHLVIILSGIACHLLMLCIICKFTLLGALMYLPVYRAVFAIPYIHVNIFQHIGLPMFSSTHKPVRIYQMSQGVLNLRKNTLLSFAFGHSLIDSHVEHHLFPGLSDSICFAIKPYISSYLQHHKLAYHEDSYFGRLWYFFKEYDELMVKAPPITHFVGIQ